jgi:hypothetical protein
MRDDDPNPFGKDCPDDIIAVVPGYGVPLSEATTIEVRAAIYFSETNWTYSESDGPLVSDAIDALGGACSPSLAEMKQTLAAIGGDVSEPVVEVERGFFIELRRATRDHLRLALDEIANPVPNEALGPLWRFMRMAFADHVVDADTIRAAIAERDDINAPRPDLTVIAHEGAWAVTARGKIIIAGLSHRDAWRFVDRHTDGEWDDNGVRQ